MPKTRATVEEIVDHFDSLPRGAGSPEARVAATARYFKVTPATLHKHLKFWWPGKKYMEEFGGTSRTPKWDRPIAELLKVVNDQGSISKAAKALNTTAVTLTKALERHKIVQRWVVADIQAESESGISRQRIRGNHAAAS